MHYCIRFLFFFFFQAEDGIRDVAVTGVQTCALPIYADAFFIITDVPNGMKHFNRAPLTTKMEGDFDTGKIGRASCRERV